MFKKTAMKTVKFREGTATKGSYNCIRREVSSRRTRDYIWITPDFLEKFTPKNDTPRRERLSLNTVHYYQTCNKINHLPPMFAERLHTLEEKAAKNLKTDVKIKESYRINRLSNYQLNLRGNNHFNSGSHVDKNQA